MGKISNLIAGKLADIPDLISHLTVCLEHKREFDKQFLQT